MTLQIDYLSTLRGRLGYAWDRSLIYATGGLAIAHMNLTANQYHPGGPGSPPFQATANSYNYGYAVGGGFQWAMLDNLSFKAEYLRIGLAEKTYTLTMAPGFAGTSTMQTGWSGSTVKAAGKSINHCGDWFFWMHCPLWVKSGQTIAGQNLPLSALVQAHKRGRNWFVR